MTDPAPIVTPKPPERVRGVELVFLEGGTLRKNQQVFCEYFDSASKRWVRVRDRPTNAKQRRWLTRQMRRDKQTGKYSYVFEVPRPTPTPDILSHGV